ncbi:MAG: GntR family transcriptional regulator [Rhodobacteraceae bacterium]|nr:GntR family transcriptional regulator [Paracoccaceae bacterium]
MTNLNPSRIGKLADLQPDRKNDGISDEEIVERIFEAVLEQRLPPGSKLSESALCTAFGVGRMRVRRSFLLLASRGVVELQSNRGAFVASPTAEQAREVFEARLAIEPNVTRHAVARASDADIHALSQHLSSEMEAHHDGKRRDAIRLSGHFHVLLAQVAANSVMLGMIKELVARTSLIIGIFGGPGPVNCRCHDHGVILDSLKVRDQEAAAAHMVAHIDELRACIDLSEVRDRSVDLVTLFSRT